MCELARALLTECERQNLSGAELARRSGVPQTAVASILRGDTDPRLSTVLRLLDGLGRSLGWLSTAMGAASARRLQR